MKDLPYFLLLIKKNALLWTIITTNSFANINLEGTVHGFWSSRCLELRDYSLNKEEQFKNIRITDDESQITIDFFTESNKYIQNIKYYFGESAISQNQVPFSNNDKANNKQIQLGEFDMGLTLPVNVEMVNYGGAYGNVIGLTIPKKMSKK